MIFDWVQEFSFNRLKNRLNIRQQLVARLGDRESSVVTRRTVRSQHQFEALTSRIDMGNLAASWKETHALYMLLRVSHVMFP